MLRSPVESSTRLRTKVDFAGCRHHLCKRSISGPVVVASISTLIVRLEDMLFWSTSHELSIRIETEGCLQACSPSGLRINREYGEENKNSIERKG